MKIQVLFLSIVGLLMTMIACGGGFMGEGSSKQNEFQGGPLPAYPGHVNFLAVTPEGDLVLTVLNGLAKVIAS